MSKQRLKPIPGESVIPPVVTDDCVVVEVSDDSGDFFSFDLTHDDFFKQTFALKPLAIGFLKVVLKKQLLRRLDLENLTIEKTVQLDTMFNEYHADMIYKVPFKKGGEVLIHCIIEHKSSNEHRTIFQLSQYVMLIHDQEDKRIEGKWNEETRLPPVIPIIIHQGKTRFTGKTQLAEVFYSIDGTKTNQMKMKAVLFDLSTIAKDSLPHDPDCPELWSVLLIMKTVFNKKDAIAAIEDIIDELKPMADDPYYRNLIRLCAHYFGSRLSPTDTEAKQLDKMLSKKIGDKDMPVFTNSYYKKGKAEGIALGEERGIALGEERGIALGEERGITLGEARGEIKSKQDIAKNLISLGMPSDFIARATGLSVKEIDTLREA